MPVGHRFILQGTILLVDVPLDKASGHHGDTLQDTLQQCQLQGYLDELGEGTNQIQDDTQLDLQDEDTVEGILVLGHIFMSLVWPREHKYLPKELFDFIGPTRQ